MLFVFSFRFDNIHLQNLMLKITLQNNFQLSSWNETQLPYSNKISLEINSDHISLVFIENENKTYDYYFHNTNYTNMYIFIYIDINYLDAMLLL